MKRKLLLAILIIAISSGCTTPRSITGDFAAPTAWEMEQRRNPPKANEPLEPANLAQIDNSRRDHQSGPDSWYGSGYYHGGYGYCRGYYCSSCY